MWESVSKFKDQLSLVLGLVLSTVRIDDPMGRIRTSGQTSGQKSAQQPGKTSSQKSGHNFGQQSTQNLEHVGKMVATPRNIREWWRIMVRRLVDDTGNHGESITISRKNERTHSDRGRLQRNQERNKDSDSVNFKAGSFLNHFNYVLFHQRKLLRSIIYNQNCSETSLLKQRALRYIGEPLVVATKLLGRSLVANFDRQTRFCLVDQSRNRRHVLKDP